MTEEIPTKSERQALAARRRELAALARANEKNFLGRTQDEAQAFADQLGLTLRWVEVVSGQNVWLTQAQIPGRVTVHAHQGVATLAVAE